MERRKKLILFRNEWNNNFDFVPYASQKRQHRSSIHLIRSTGCTVYWHLMMRINQFRWRGRCSICVSAILFTWCMYCSFRYAGYLIAFTVCVYFQNGAANNKRYHFQFVIWLVRMQLYRTFNMHSTLRVVGMAEVIRKMVQPSQRITLNQHSFLSA